ncbi:DNA adenine methylase [Caballeronia sp. LjRoot34]|uniref:DNA adenine methylase n=1 Tax=Caballeronia sp. LjRoot34 TaxID=3342325 RepID=UPI003ECEC761
MPRKFVNPLRYPGGKARFYAEFKQFFIDMGLHGKQVVEPYAGSASISFALLNDGLASSAMLFERDPLVFAFWQSVFRHTDELLRRVSDLQVNMKSWNGFRPLLDVSSPDEWDLVELGVAGLFFNRTNFSGVLHAGPIGGNGQNSAYKIDCRFNKDDLLRRIQEAAGFADKFEVYFGDAVSALTDANNVDNSGRVFYVDPPYFKEGRKLYRYSYQLSDHRRLANALTAAKYNWILSYDRHHVIEFLYDDFNRIDKLLRYSSKAPKQGAELLITNLTLAPVILADGCGSEQPTELEPA